MKIFAEWRSDHPVLTGCETVADLVSSMPSLDVTTVDSVFSLLLSYATNLGHPASQVAARILLQLMLPKVAQLATSLGYVREIADREAFAVTGMYEAIRTYPLARWPRMTPLCLARWGRWLIHRSARHLRSIRASEVPVDFEEETWLTDHLAERGSEPEVEQFLAWAVRRGSITQREAARLLANIRDGSAVGTAGREGIQAKSMWQWRNRVLKRLRRAAAAYDPDLPF